MADRRFEIDADIRKARTPPKELYVDPELFAAQRERVFERSWLFASPAHGLEEPGAARPFTLLPGCIDEPLVLVRDTHRELHCLSNVCTHRANIIVERECSVPNLRCKYHGRRFHLDGTFAFMPEFEDVAGFPSEKDWLQRLPVAAWRDLVFVSLAPATSANAVIAAVEARLAGVDVTQWTFDASSSRDYLIDANWALYCENYLEGFHIPFVHEALNQVLDFKRYRTETFEHGSVQVGVAAEGEPAFHPPAGHPDHGAPIGAWYFFLFPNTMLNVYPWGLSLNVVEPIAVNKTRVRFLAFVTKPELRGAGAGGDLHRVEMEDEDVVQSVQRGVKSRLYRGGRYSPTQEIGVHHFHRWLAEQMGG